MAEQNQTKPKFRTSIGGQALIEGILMRGPEKQAIVVRSKEGLVEKVEELKLIRDRYPILGLPVLRGAVTFVDSMVRGVKALMYSADFFPEEEGEPSKLDLWLEKKLGSEKLQKLVVALAVVLLAAFAAFKLYRDRRASFPLTYREQVEALSAEYGVPVPLIFAVVKAESGFRPEAQSYAGACGLMQLMPATYREIAGRLGEDCDESLIFDPTQNLRYGVYYLSYLYRYFGDYYTALAAYNAGIGRVSGWVADSRYSSDGVTLHSIPIAETETYVRRIRDYEQTYTKILEKEG